MAWSAALAVGMLLGYFVLAVALVAGLGFLAFEAVTRPGTAAIGGKLGLITGLVAVAVLRAAFVVERRGDEAQDGVLVWRQDEPELWALVDEVSAELGVQAPDDLRLVEDVNAFVHQDTRLLGLVGGRRHMCIGLPLLHVLTVDQLRGVIGHELGHKPGVTPACQPWSTGPGRPSRGRASTSARRAVSADCSRRTPGSTRG